jgi:hypothetical protein
MAARKQTSEEALDSEKVEERKTRDGSGNVVKNEADTNPELQHGDPEAENPKSKAGVDSDDKKAMDKASEARHARGPVGVAQNDDDGWGDIPVQMRDQ